VVGRQPAVVRAEPHRLVHLRGQDGVIAVPAALQPSADGLLRDAVPLLHVRGLRAAVDVGGVEEVDARIDRGVHDRETGCFVHCVAEVHGAEADPADQQTGTAQVPVGHFFAHGGSIRTVLPPRDALLGQPTDTQGATSSPATSGSTWTTPRSMRRSADLAAAPA
jgi:hypothetical protein